MTMKTDNAVIKKFNTIQHDQVSLFRQKRLIYIYEKH